VWEAFTEYVFHILLSFVITWQSSLKVVKDDLVKNRKKIDEESGDDDNKNNKKIKIGKDDTVYLYLKLFTEKI